VARSGAHRRVALKVSATTADAWCMSSDQHAGLTLGSVFEGFETDSRRTTPTLARLMTRVRLLVWPPACSQPHH
jgi:hypothetical protein